MSTKVEILQKSAGPAGVSRHGEQIRVSGSSVIVRWPHFMLQVPKPATKTQ